VTSGSPTASRLRRPTHTTPLVLSISSLVAAVAVVVPISYIAIRASDRGWDGIEATLWRRRMLTLIWRSVSLAGAVTAASVLIGVASAWLVSRTDLPGRRVWRVVLGLPLAMPSYVAAWSWIGWSSDLAGFVGAWIVLTTISYPFVYFPVLGALQRADPGREEIARSLGAGASATFWRVTFPEIRIAATGGALLVGLYTLSDFGGVSIMRYEAMTHVIYRSYRATFDRTPPAIIGCVLIVISTLIVLTVNRLQRRDPVARLGAGAPRPPVPHRLGVMRIPSTLLLVALMTLTFGVPARTLVLWSYRGRSTTDWSRWLDATVTTLSLGVAAAAVTVVVALPIAMLSARYPGRLSSTVTTIAYAGHSLPGIVVALSMVFFGIRVVPSLYQEIPMLTFAYVVLFLSLALGAMHNSIAQVPASLDEIARSLGRTQRGAWTAITLRLAAPGIGVAAALVCVTVMKELPATLLLRPIGTETLATRLWSHTDARSYAAAAPYAAAIVVFAAIPTAALSRFGARAGRDRHR